MRKPFIIRFMEKTRLFLSRLGVAHFVGYRPLWEVASLHQKSAAFSVIWTTDENYVKRTGLGDAEKLKSYLSQDSVVADLGAGHGRVAMHVAPLVEQLWLIDISANMLRHARRRLRGLPNVSFLRSDLRCLKRIPDETFHLSYSFLCLQHLEKEDAYLAIREAARVTKRGWFCYFQVPNLASEKGTAVVSGLLRGWRQALSGKG